MLDSDDQGLIRPIRHVVPFTPPRRCWVVQDVQQEDRTKRYEAFAGYALAAVLEFIEVIQDRVLDRLVAGRGLVAPYHVVGDGEQPEVTFLVLFDMGQVDAEEPLSSGWCTFFTEESALEQVLRDNAERDDVQKRKAAAEDEQL